MFQFPVNQFPVFYFFFRAVLLGMLILLLPYFFNDFINKAKSKNKSGWLSICIVFLFVFYLLELFLTFYPETNGKNDTYCSKTWMYYYWKQNKEGFRDIDFESMPLNKPSIVFAGDSYTEGHGIKDPSKRVSDLCRNRFPDFNVYNIGKCGMDINDEIKLITHLPVHSDIIVLQICSNDWDYLYKPVSMLPSVNHLLLAEVSAFSLTKYSVLLNYFQSRFENLRENYFLTEIDNQYKSKILNAFKINKAAAINSNNELKVLKFAVEHTKLQDDSIEVQLFRMLKEYNTSLKVMTDTVLFNRYLDKLSYLKAFCDQHMIKLVVVPYPNLDKFSMNVTSKYTNRYLTKLIKDRGIDCLDTYPDLKKASLSSYTVNNIDMHINEKASAIVADVVISHIKKMILKR